MMIRLSPELRECMAGRVRNSGNEHNAPHPIDVMAGTNLRLARLRAGLSQTQLGDAIDITFQQIQKYESGKNRMSLSCAYELTKVLKISVTDLFGDTDGLPPAALLDAPLFSQWIALYERARSARLLSELIGLVKRLVTICEESAREASRG